MKDVIFLIVLIIIIINKYNFKKVPPQYSIEEIVVVKGKQSINKKINVGKAL